MSWMLVAAALTVSPSEPIPNVVAAYTSRSAAITDLATEMQTGTLLFSEGDCLAVRIYTKSPYTHVAAVVVRDGKPFVYDSTNGVGVRRQSLEKYLASQRRDMIHVFQPVRPLSDRHAARFEEYLESQLGRPYALKHHLTGKRVEGIHCSEYVTDALCECKLLHAQEPPRVSPGSLAAGIVEGELYTAAKTVHLMEPSPPKPEGRNWCDQLWVDTKVCTRNCCTKLQGWFLCR